MALAGEKEGRQTLYLYRNWKLEKTLELKPPAEKRKLGNVEWSPDGKTLYVTTICGREHEGPMTLGFLEIPLAGGAPREVSVLRVSQQAGKEKEPGEVDSNAWQLARLFNQIALSPDGKTIAVSWPADANATGGLYLVDLESPERKVKRIPFPVPAKPLPAEKKEK